MKDGIFGHNNDRSCVQSLRLLLRGLVTYVADHGGAVVDEEAAVPPGDLGVRRGADRADEAHVLALDDLLVGGGGGDEGGAGQFTASQVPDELAADPVREGAVGLRLVRD